MSGNLKGFEKQWKDLQKINCWGASGYDKQLARVIWQAALNWVLENFDGKTDMLELALRIRKEMDYE